jgi:RNA polymerase sigma factor (sigma-70 family)
MVSSPVNRVLRSLRRAALQGETDGMTDRQLLERFLATREEAAFEALVRRHGPMILGVCRRVLDHQQDAEDACQATFLVLASKASSILQRETLANWLYGVAYRTAQKALVAAARRRLKEKQMARPEAFNDARWEDLRPLLDQELNSLPDKYREPLILCDLQGMTRKAAADQLGWSEGTVSGRLSRARELLAKRLVRHGVIFSAAAVATALSSTAASACVSSPLVSSTVHAATCIAAGQAVSGVVSAPVAALTKGVLKAMLISKLKTVSAVLIAVGLLAIGAAICRTQPGPEVAGQEGVAKSEGPKAEGAAKTDAAKLPTGMPPFQALVSLVDGKLIVKSNGMGFRVGVGAGGGGAGGFPGGGGGVVPGPGGGIQGGGAGGGNPAPGGIQGGGGGGGGNPAPGGGLPGGGGGGGIRAGGRFGGNNDGVQTQTYQLKDVKVFDTKGKQIDNKELAKLVKEETLAMVTWGQSVDPLHLRLLRDGTLTFVLPAPQGVLPGGGFKAGPGAPPGPGAGPSAPPQP